MSEEWQAYIKDARTVCKYGANCYQKNPEHHQNFKHPPVNNKRKGGHNSPAGKRYKPSPKHVKSPAKTENSRKDREHDKNKDLFSGDLDKSHNQSGENDLDSDQASTSKKEETLSMKLPETLSIHDKNRRKVGHNSPAGKYFKPSPKHVKSPANTENSRKDREHDKTSGDHDKSHNQSTNNNSASEASASNKDESYSINLPETLSYYDKDNYALLKEIFLVEMPDDFFKFYKCLQEEQDLEKMLSSVNLQLIGPYDLLLGKLPVLDDKELYLVHWKFFYDPPEFQAVLKKKGKSEYHIGYFRDEPNSAPVFLAHNDSAKGCHITPMADNIFGAVYLYLQNEKKSSPFTSIACQKLMDKMKKWAETHNYSIEEYNMKKRLAQSITKTFHGAGIVVPFNKKTELGYRKLVETDANLKKLFAKLESCKTQNEKDKILSEIQPVITYASIAVDECDFGTGLECGIDLFCSGLKELQPSALGSLQAVYSLLNRDAFSKIIAAHIKYRRRGPNMSVLSFSTS